jgi:hypothetical protein
VEEALTHSIISGGISKNSGREDLIKDGKREK